MQVIASKTWNELNRMEITFGRKNKFTYIAVSDNIQLYRQNNITYDLQCTNSNNNNW